MVLSCYERISCHSKGTNRKDAGPGFAIVCDQAFDGREELRFHNTHPLIDQYIRQNFELIFDQAGYRIYRTREAAQ